MTAIDLSIQMNREKRELERRALAAIVEAKYGKMPPSPIRQPGETDGMFMDRLKAWRNGPREPLPEEQPAESQHAEAGPGP